MDKEQSTEAYIHTVQEEYARIDGRWLRLHYQISVVLVVFSLLVELIMGLFLIRSDMLRTTTSCYFLKFLIIPSGINLLFLLMNTLMMQSQRLTQRQKITAIALNFLFINFVLFVVHNAFVAIYYISAITVLLTVIYADYRITGYTSLVSISSLVYAELFTRWDVDKVSIFESTHRLSEFLVSLILLVTFSLACMVVIRFEREKNQASIQKEIERQQLRQRVQLDDLTGLYNRRAFRDQMKFLEDAAPDGQQVLAMVDIDRFKEINDTWGHHAGDRCLAEFAGVLKELEPQLLPFRYGGDEFCLLFRDADMDKAEALCRDVQAKVSALVFPDYPQLAMTVSIGLAELVGPADTVRLFIHADQALYKAKKARNTICIFQ